MDNDIWSLGEITDHMRDEVLLSETPHCGSGVVYKNSGLLLHSVVSDLFQRRDAPSHSNLLLWVSKWGQEG